MKWSTLLGVGAVSAAILLAAATRHFWLPDSHAANDAWTPPLATPPGITMQLATQDKQSGSSAQQIVFADAKGMTLYTYARDTVGNGARQADSACVGDCARSWTPAPAAPDAGGAADWSVLHRADGSSQWCYRGAPVYTFSDDAAPGDVKGQGSANGAWGAAVFLPEAAVVLPDSITVRHLPDAAGTALATPEGLTLYAFDDNLAHPLAGRWRPLEAGAMASPAGDFTVIARQDGITQWAFHGRPLYLFDGDRKAGEARGTDVDARVHVALVRRYFMPADATIRPLMGLGNALVTRGGATLYQRDRVQPGEDNHDFHADHGPPALGRFYGTSTCDANCAKAWPPYPAPPNAVASGYWDVLTRSDGTTQWTYKGFALYRYSGDAPGEARGNRLYELVRIDDAGQGEDAAGGTRPPLELSASDEAAYVKFVAHGNAAGIGVGALFWRAVAP